MPGIKCARFCHLSVTAPSWLADMRAPRLRKRACLRPRRSDRTPMARDPNRLPRMNRLSVRGPSHSLGKIFFCLISAIF